MLILCDRVHEPDLRGACHYFFLLGRVRGLSYMYLRETAWDCGLWCRVWGFGSAFSLTKMSKYFTTKTCLRVVRGLGWACACRVDMEMFSMESCLSRNRGTYILQGDLFRRQNMNFACLSVERLQYWLDAVRLVKIST